jgi:hypothetical protein
MSSQNLDSPSGGAPLSLREHWERILQHLENLYAQRPSEDLQRSIDIAKDALAKLSDADPPPP